MKQRALKSDRPVLTLDRVNECVEYRARDGLFFWKINTGKKMRPGDIAGSVDGSGYVNIQIDGWTVPAHILAWWIKKRQRPTFELDHRNSVRSDNSFDNLRPATRAQQSANSRKQGGTSSKFKGVTRDKRRNCWVAQMTVDKNHIHLGQFADEQDAARAYNTAALRQFGEFARLNLFDGE